MRVVDSTIASMRWPTVATGAACDSAAAQAAAIGAACEVPPYTDVPPVRPVDVTNAPAANRSVVGLRLAKQAGLRAAVVASLQPRKSSTAPRSESQVAATDRASRMQAGAWICCALPWLPVETVTTAPLATSAPTPAARACVHAVLASQWPGKVSSLPRLRFTAATSGWWVATQSIAATTSEAQQ